MNVLPDEDYNGFFFAGFTSTDNECHLGDRISQFNVVVLFVTTGVFAFNKGSYAELLVASGFLLSRFDVDYSWRRRSPKIYRFYV